MYFDIANIFIWFKNYKTFLYTQIQWYFYTTRRMNCGYIIVEFRDGLQLIPAVWYNTDKQSCIWPSSHYETKLRIYTAIIRQEIPKNESDWEELSIKRIFGVADKWIIYSLIYIHMYMLLIIFFVLYKETYEKGLEKLVAVQDISNIKNDISSIELREKKNDA